MGTGSIYIVDTYCRQRRIHLYFPNAQLRRFWTIECEDKLYKELSAPNEEGIYMNPVPPIEENHDVLVVFALIEKLKKEYNIDEERIYMQGNVLRQCNDNNDGKTFR